ncbi:MAG TPA: hypothetical protein VFD27_15525 [Chthoniobacteraceae bacterium]|nr:hypothetical protein [Chthoniobacteraceae bacterium]
MNVPIEEDECRGVRKFALVGLLVAVATVFFLFDPLLNCLRSVTGQPRTWVRQSSPMRTQLQNVWRQWKEDDLSISADVQSIARIIRSELAPGANDDAVRQHVRKHFQKADFQPLGARKETVYWIDAYGIEGGLFHRMEVLQVWYISDQGRFVRAELQMRVPKAADLRSIDLTRAAPD